MVQDDLFAQYANDQQKEAEARSQKGSGNAPQYEEIKWTGLAKDDLKLVRAVGGPPDSKVDDFTAKTTRVSWIHGDDGKRFRCILPEAADAPDHILWNIIQRVKRSEWVDGKRICPIERDMPEIYNLVAKNGISQNHSSFMFDKGWTGRHVLIMNVIDREQADWHKENKHTMLLSRNIGVGADGREYPEVGVPSYGFSGSLGNLFKFYKSWEKYDIGITRTGLKEAPYRVINASKYIEEVPDSKKDLVVEGGLTDEERAYEQYDLNKLFKFTTYTKIYNHLKGKIARIDAALNTNFLAELKYKVDQEKAEWEAQKADETKQEMDLPTSKETTFTSEDTIETPVQESAPTRTRAPRQTESVPFGATQLPGFDKLSEEQKNAIADVVKNEAGDVLIKYKDESATVLACPECGVPSPETFTSCPNCGIDF